MRFVDVMRDHHSGFVGAAFPSASTTTSACIEEPPVVATPSGTVEMVLAESRT
jgi:hypothetical protein